METLWSGQTFTGLSYQRTSSKDLSPSSNGLGSLPLIPYHYLKYPPCPMCDLKGKRDKEGLVMGSLRDNVHHDVSRTAICLHQKPIIFKIRSLCPWPRKIPEKLEMFFKVVGDSWHFWWQHDGTGLFFVFCFTMLHCATFQLWWQWFSLGYSQNPNGQWVISTLVTHVKMEHICCCHTVIVYGNNVYGKTI